MKRIIGMIFDNYLARTIMTILFEVIYIYIGLTIQSVNTWMNMSELGNYIYLGICCYIGIIQNDMIYGYIDAYLRNNRRR